MDVTFFVCISISRYFTEYSEVPRSVCVQKISYLAFTVTEILIFKNTPTEH